MNKLVSKGLSFANALSPWVLLASVILVCWFLAATLWLVIAPPKQHHLTPVNAAPQSTDINVSGGVFSVFETPKPKKVEKKRPVVNTNFKLEGVFVSSPESNSSALINSSGTVKRYRVGSKIDDTNYRVVSVIWNKAFLEDDAGNEVELKLHEPFDLNSGQESLRASSSSSSNYAARSPTPSSYNKPVIKKRSVKEQMNDMFDQAVTELKSNPAGYLTKMGVMATGDGYEVTSGMNSQIRQNIGLKSGDKVISVNGQSVGQPQQDARLLEEIQRSGSAEIQVQRGSQIITVRQQF